MEERHLSQIIHNMVERFDLNGPDSFDLDSELRKLNHPITLQPISKDILQQIEKSFLEQINYKKSHDTAILVPVSVVSNPKIHEEWYGEWLSENNNRVKSYYWKQLEDFLSYELTRKYGAEDAGRVVRSIDEATKSIMYKLANPTRREFTYKGLVVGYVQSGKTANFTALISKAVDAGYKFVVVLSGVHSVLRRQTQIRLDKELTGMNDLNIDEPFISEPSEPKLWNRITTANVRRTRSRSGQVRYSDLGEFDTRNFEPFHSLCNRSTPTLAVIKKNVKVLDKLIEYIITSNKTDRAKMPVLIIDDEADQASVDGKANVPDSNPTDTNERIRRILSLFPRRAYVGYTATPFANVLIDMKNDHAELLDDLYPRNFIISLPEPEGYFGTRMIFQGNLSQFFIEEVQSPSDEFESLLGNGEITDHLSRAIDQYILCCAVRNLRDDRFKPMSMLVHITHSINYMSALNDIIEQYINEIKGRYKNTSYSNGLKIEFERIWQGFSKNSVSIRKELGLKNYLPEFESIWEEVGNVFQVLRIIELNSSSEDRLDYSSGDEVKIIAIGGNQLSRGLTLEGLMTSYYLRDSRQYDTLLQMGRWFGYRKGYEDLTRIHTSQQIWEFFEHLALVEEELRSQIYRYEEEELTPAEMAVAIRDHQRMSITAPNKMGAGRPRQTSFSKSLIQTIWLPLNEPEKLRANFNLGESFIRNLNSGNGFKLIPKTGVHLIRNIRGTAILTDFLERYTFVEKEHMNGPGLDYESLLSYIRRRLAGQNPELQQWNVGVVGNISSNYLGDPIDFGGFKINRVGRSRKYTSKGYNIGVLTESAHLKIDLPRGASDPYDGRSSQSPLLLLYPIAKESKAHIFIQNPQNNQRIDLFRFVDNKHLNVLGIAIVLPHSQNEPSSFIGQ
jgi:hypothetical protein